MKWLPISTAPKDKTQVIVRFVSAEGGVEAKNAWFDGGWDRICNLRNTHEYFSFGDVTHWMPLPEPPGSEPSLHAQAKAIMDEMTDEERLSLMQEYCVYCGTKRTPCYCTRDD